MAQEDLSYLERLQPRWTFPNRPEEPVFRLAGRRAEDLLVFDLRVINLKIAADQPPRLVRESADRSSGIILDFQPQHFGEQAFLDATGPEVASIPEGEEFNETAPGVEKNVATAAAEPAGPLPAARIRMAGKSRLAFTMPDDTDSLPLTFEAVLTACQRWAPRLSSLAVAEPMLRPATVVGNRSADQYGNFSRLESGIRDPRRDTQRCHFPAGEHGHQRRIAPHRRGDRIPDRWRADQQGTQGHTQCRDRRNTRARKCA
jgi:hypothetical protein